MGEMLSRFAREEHRAHGALLQKDIGDGQRPTKKRHEGAYGMQCLGQYQVQAMVVLMSHARPAFPRATS